MAKIVLITGASSGLGKATARHLANARGCTVVVVARREDRLKTLAAELHGSYVAVDLTAEDAPARIRAHIADEYGDSLDSLVNNAGAAWRGTFADTGAANLRKHMELNFDAQARLTEVLLPVLRQNAPSSIVNVASTAGHVGRAGSAAYSASKAALIKWSNGLYLEERPHGVHVGIVNPGFVATEGFPQAELQGKLTTRWMLGTTEQVAEAIAQCALDGKAERFVPRGYAVAAALGVIAPGLYRRALGGGAAKAFTTKTGHSDDPST